MKKLMTAFCAMASMAALAAVNNTVITFSTPGPDKYADGSVVRDGECYALVWTKAGATFGGFAADGSAAVATDKVVLTAPVASAGRCPTVKFEIDADFASANYANGSFAVYLLDTRKADGSLAGVGADGRAAAVNAASDTGVTVKSGDFGGATQAAGGVAVSATPSAIPEGTPQPSVKSIRIVGANVFITLAGTVPYLQYDVKSGTDPKSEFVKQNAGVQGASAGEEAVIVRPVSKGGSEFFQVIRN